MYYHIKKIPIHHVKSLLKIKLEHYTFHIPSFPLVNNLISNKGGIQNLSSFYKSRLIISNGVGQYLFEAFWEDTSKDFVGTGQGFRSSLTVGHCGIMKSYKCLTREVYWMRVKLERKSASDSK